jgi:alkane 1-monooxygenase
MMSVSPWKPNLTGKVEQCPNRGVTEAMLRFCGPFLFLAGIPLLYYSAGPLASLAAALLLPSLLIAAELLPAGWVPEPQPPTGGFRLLPIFYIPLQLGVIFWSVSVVASLNATGFVALAFSVGVTAGVFGMLCAHEMAHSRRPFHRFVALAMLTGTGNRHFRISHIFGHHRWAGTERDAATARLGESFYAFLLRTLRGQWREAWEFEQRRCSARGLGWLNNRTLQDILVMVLVYVVLFVAFGIRGALFFLCQGATAIIVLELFNYVAHYGLFRDTHVDGAPSPFSGACSWNASNAFANFLIFNMVRHSDHHHLPTASYHLLSEFENAPELPCGYAGSILLALFPPLWRRVMDHRIFQLKSRQDRFSNSAERVSKIQGLGRV